MGLYIPQDLIDDCRDEESGRLFQPEPGMGISYSIGSDTYPYTIRQVSPSGHQFTATRDRFVGKPGANAAFSEAEMVGMFVPTEGEAELFTRKRDGRYQMKGQPYSFVHAGRKYKIDPCF